MGSLNNVLAVHRHPDTIYLKLASTTAGVILWLAQITTANAYAPVSENNPYTPKVLEAAFRKAIVLSPLKPESEIVDFEAKQFAAQSGKFNSPLKQYYELQPKNLMIDAMLGDTKQPATNDYKDVLFDNRGKYTTEIFNLSKAIIANLPAAKPYTYMEPGISSNFTAQLNSGQSWAAATRDWSINAQTWKTPEALVNPGLERVNAYYAYALGMTGKGVNVGVLDSGILTEHFEFQGKNAQGQDRVQAVTSTGEYYATHPRYLHDTPDGEFQKGEHFSISGEYDPVINDGHGTEMSGVLGASRNGTGMHGIAFDANLFVANTGGTDDNRFQGSNDLDYNAFMASYNALAAKNVSIVNQSWGQNSRNDVENHFGNVGDSAADNLRDMTAAYRPFWDKAHAGQKTWMDAMADAARQNTFIQIISAGNDSHGANPDTNANLPFFKPDIESKWLSITGYDETSAQVYNRCGTSKWWCVMGVSGIPSTRTEDHLISNSNGTSAAAPSVSGALALVIQRFPYMSASQARDVLLTTASLQAPDGADTPVGAEEGPRTGRPLQPVYNAPPGTPQVPGVVSGWGLPNLQKAMQGPGQLLGSMAVALPAGIRDIWANPISDEAIRTRRVEDTTEQAAWTATKQQKGWLNGLPANASADDQFQYEIGNAREQATLTRGKDLLTGNTYVGSLIKSGDGEHVLEGHNTYSGSTWVRGGKLSVDGSLTSAVTVDGSAVGTRNPENGVITTLGGTLAGNGTIGTLTINNGGSVAPGHSIGTLRTQGVTFNPGSQYVVDVNRNGQSDQIQSNGTVTLNGGVVTVSMQNDTNLLTLKETRSLLGQRLNILSAGQSVKGQFSTVLPNSLFISSQLIYQPNQVTLKLDRNQTSFASIGQTRNERAVAMAADTLSAGNPVYESILSSKTAAQARQAFSQLNGQIYSDITGALISDSRYIRDAINGRLQQAQALSPNAQIQASHNGGWVQLLGGHNNIKGDGNASGYSSSISGVLLGLDTDMADGWRFGAATGYSQTKLNGSLKTKVESANYHLSLYGGKQYDTIALRIGETTTWHDLNTKRRVSYDSQLAYPKADYSARTDQVFAEIGYTRWSIIQPFASLTYLNHHDDSFKEKGGAATLHADKQNQNAALSNLGLRAHTKLPISSTSSLHLQGELGWEHQLSNTDRKASLKLTGSDTAFAVNSVPVARDGATIKASAEMALTQDTLVSLNYSGMLSAKGNSNGLNAEFTFRF
ncbi:autotransporter outer membrane beta-barrel domain-containing protein [Pseudomonas sp. CCM 7893]|uniref:Autotransporter outer membrane beta-barrel domain-containing protein n=1 Tax=Pseudomonas spelaei TaxID=1055469 RepID=A0A6I3WCF1_9PSED|nr:autotransporter serine protease [Pseudomonas spelaei]MUF07945.1 autotransporter outer membrane beta-barrel domain-containing protein [Pseudomonas spelaei]